MSSIVIALPKIEDARKIRSVLERHGISVAAVCSSAASALSNASQLDCGLLISSFRLPDMTYPDLAQCLPSDFEVLLLGTAQTLSAAPHSVLSLQLPIKAADLVNTVHMILSKQEQKRRRKKNRPRARSWKEQNYISNAKMVLMERNHLSEEEAYRYIQKSSMDTGTNMVETAQMILMLFFEE